MMDASAPPTPPTDISRVDQLLARALPPLERTLSRVLPDVMVRALVEFLVFGIKQAWACLFGGLMLAGLLVSAWLWPSDAALARYDALVLYAIGIQVVFLVSRLERPQEALVILIFHAVGTAMEVFKTHVGSWSYPEDSLLRIGEVPLFSGFMYAAVGSYLARVVRVFEFRFDRYPRRRWTLLVGGLIYLNFFSHHYVMDIRWALMVATVVVFGPTIVSYRVWRWRHKMPLALGFFLVAIFIWIAENIGTVTGTWLYPDQNEGWKIVSLSKMTAWYLLMIISWVLVTLVHPPRRGPAQLSSA